MSAQASLSGGRRGDWLFGHHVMAERIINVCEGHPGAWFNHLQHA